MHAKNHSKIYVGLAVGTKLACRINL